MSDTSPLPLERTPPAGAVEGTIGIASSKASCKIALRGAELLSLRTSAGVELLWQRNPQWWERSSPILFPIIGRPHDGQVVYHGQRYPMPQHGVAHSAAFDLVEHHEDRCVLRLRDDARTRASFPFSFTLTVGYALRGSRLYVQATVQNTRGEPMPAAFGFHPGFACDPTVNYSLDFGTEDPGQFRRGGVITPSRALPATGRQLPIRDDDFADGALLLSPYRGSAITLVANASPLARLQAHQLGTLAIWKKPGAPFICIEPWSAPPISLSARGEDLALSGFLESLPSKAERHYGMVIETAP
jgi:galactose mutarotase-like enzyme